MKKITSILLTGLLMVLSFVSCSKDDNTIVIYSCTEDYKNEFYLAELQKKFPEVNFVLDYQGSGAAAAKLKAEGLQTEGDILLSWEYTYFDMLTDYLADLSYFDTSNYMEDMLTPTKKYLPECRNSGAIVINTELLKEKGLAEPTSYQDLIKTEYKGLLSMPNPKSSGTGYMFLRNLVNAWGVDAAYK
jgi:iron(III) transport system substrate-binding protein